MDLYSQLLKEAVSELAESGDQTLPSGSASEELPRLDLPLPARIPEDYISHMPSRLAIYQRIARIKERREVPLLREELRERFGPLPQEVENLMLLADLRALAGGLGIESILRAGDAVVLHLRQPVGGARVPLQRALGPSVDVGSQQVQMSLRRLGDEWLTRLTRVIERFQVFQANLRALAKE